MKYSVLLILLMLTACGMFRKPTSSGIKDIMGLWYPIREEIAGTKIPPVAFQSHKLELSGNHYVMTAESVDKGEFRIKGRQMDIYGKEGANAGKHLKAIYELKNNLLTICYDLEGSDYPSSFETKNHALYFMAVFEKR